ncbi:MAG: hypothetical protein IJ191_02185 [Treponema sp.]|nr:hypothetical protein [Treponema sp.]
MQRADVAATTDSESATVALLPAAFRICAHTAQDAGTAFCKQTVLRALPSVVLAAQ